MSDWMVAGLALVVAGMAFIGLGVPLLAGKIGRNRVYGYRIKSTLRDDRVWYPVNALSGMWLIWAGVLSLVIGALLLIFRNREAAAQVVIAIGLPAMLVCLAVGIYRGWKLAVAIDERLHAVDEGQRRTE